MESPWVTWLLGFPGSSEIKTLPSNMGDTGDSVSPETSWGRKTLGGGNGNPSRYSYLGNPMDRGTWWAIVLRVAESQMQVSTDAHNLAVPRDYCCSVSKSCPTLCDPMNCSIPGFPVLHYHQEFAQTHVHERMVTHSSFLAWKIPWTEETAGLWSRGSDRVRHDWTCTYALVTELSSFPSECLLLFKLCICIYTSILLFNSHLISPLDCKLYKCNKCLHVYLTLYSQHLENAQNLLGIPEIPF